MATDPLEKKIMSNSKCALITGSTSGIGLATAKVFAAAGYDLMLNGIESNTDGQQIADALKQAQGIRAFYCQADLSRTDEVEKLVQAADDALGQIDVLINNAGIQFTAPIGEFPDQKWDQILAINLSAAFHAMKRCMPGMKSRGWGRVINIASVHGLVASANKAAYCAAKHGLVGLSKVAALEYAADRVTVNCICPGWTDTPLLNDQFQAFADSQGVSFEEAKLGVLHTKTPYPELVDPEAIGAMAAYLCSDAAQAVTGAALPIDGAWTAQ